MQESKGTCAFCGEKEVSTLQFHHIDGRDIPDPHDPQNLIYVCGTCHDKITAGVLSYTDVKLQKRMQFWLSQEQAQPAGQTQSVEVNGTVNTGTIANVVNYKVSGKKKPKPPPAAGAIANDLMKRNYIKHLIDRYNKFVKDDGTKKRFHFSVIYNSIKTEFGTDWDMVPLERFPDLAAYMQGRIDNTKLGRGRRKRGQKSYSTFEQYVEKYATAKGQ